MYVGRRMTLNPITATPETTHSQAFKLMQEHDIRHLPILDHDRLVGIVTDKDLLKAEPSPATTLSIYEVYALLDNLKLRSIMVTPVYTVEENCPLEEAARILMQHKITGLPVMRGERLMGIITEMDIFRAFVEVLGGDERGLAFSVKLADRPGALATVTRAVADAGGNIISLVTFQPSSERGTGEVYIKEEGADREKLEKLIAEETHADLLEIGPVRRYEPRLFGQKK
jgi:acetoin utilization protein AcuB